MNLINPKLEEVLEPLLKHIYLPVKDMEITNELILQALSHNLGTPLGAQSVSGEKNVTFS